MDQRLSLISLYVSDIKRSRAFYEDGLGFTPVAALDDVCFYQLNGFLLALNGPGVWQKENVPGPQPGPASLAICLRSKEEADKLLEHAGTHGGRVLKRAHDTYWGGYTGYFADPDGHYWEAGFNPFWTITSDGRTLAAQPAK